MAFLLWLVAAILVIVGIVQLFQGQIIFGVLLIVARDEPMRGGGAFRGAAVDDSAVVTGRRGLVVSPRGGGVHDTSGHPLRCD